MRLSYSRLAIAVAFSLVTTSTFAQQTGGKASTLDTVIVTGTRVSDRTVAESASPIDIVTPEALAATGTTELATALARALPSLNFPRPALVDGSSGVRPAQLRGLSPDQTLVLVNGKRYHPSAMLNINGSMGRGSAAVDLNTIPVASIERVEVLRDGASAQYGSDAIAGVVNIVLKGSGEGGSLSATYGQYSKGDGQQYQIAGDGGIQFADGRGALHLAGQYGDQDATNRAGVYNGSSPNSGNNPGVGERGFVVGDPKVNDYAVSANGGFDFTDHVRGYLTAIASDRDITSYAFYRSRNHNNQADLLSKYYPNGYAPEINQRSKDLSFILGLQGDTDGGFTWDVSYNFSQNKLDYYTRNTINYTMGTESPTSFYAGALDYTQNILNADFTQALDWGLAYPVTLSFGAEYRDEKWVQGAGEEGSYNNAGLGISGSNTGAQGFPGFTPENAVHANRHNYAAYVGLEADFTDKFSAGLTGRYEDYSDFGDKFSGKLSARYAFTDRVALRGTVATGFRAPSLVQQSFQSISSTYTNNVFTQSGIFPAESASAKALGATSLKAESSTSFSAGLVLQPTDLFSVTIDAYQIQVDDRILLSSNVDISKVQAAKDLLSSLGVGEVTSFRYFTNAADTRTRGVDVVSTYTVPFSSSALDLTASYGYGSTKITQLDASPTVLSDLGITTALVGRDEEGRLEDSFPKSKVILGGTWHNDNWSVGLTATRYGSVTVRDGSATAGVYDDQRFAGKWLADITASYKPTDQWTLTLGVDNVFNTYPDENIAVNSQNGNFKYSSYSPFGFNGTYMYARVGYTW